MPVFLLDGGSTDGTAKAGSGRFPWVRLIGGDGTLYWAGGMRKAMAAALAEAFALYLWLNDDTSLFPDSIARLAATLSQLQRGGERPILVVGSTRNPETQELSYGGFRQEGGPVTKR